MLAVAINFFSSKKTDEEHVMHLKSHNVELMIDDKAGEVSKEPFETSMKGSSFVLIVLICYNTNVKINSNSGSYIFS